MDSTINLNQTVDTNNITTTISAPQQQTVTVTKTDEHNSIIPNLSSQPNLGSSTSLGMELLANPNKTNDVVSAPMQQQQQQQNVTDVIGTGQVDNVSDMTSPRSEFSLDLGFSQPQQMDNTVPEQSFNTTPQEPIDPDAPVPVHMLTASEMAQEKQEFLYKFKRLESAGINPSENFGMNSDLNTMRDEYSRLKKLRDLDSSIKFQKKMLMAAVTGIEFLNDKFDPFDVQLGGWGESINEGLGDYDEVFEELHDKYKSKAKIAPELRLIFMLGGSAFMFHLQNTMFKSAIPGMGDIMKQNPDLMKQFAQAAMSSAANGGGGGMPGGMGGMPGGMGGMAGMFGGMGGMGQQQQQQQPQQHQQQQMRPEMRGPPVEEVLSGFNQSSNVSDRDNMSDISSIAGDIYTNDNQGESGGDPTTLDLKL